MSIEDSEPKVRVSRRGFLKAAAGVAGAAALAGCAPAAPPAAPAAAPAAATAAPAAPTAAPPPAQPVTVKYWYWGDPPLLQPFLDLIDRFNTGQSAVKVEGEAIGWGDYYTKVINSIATGTPPDIARLKEWWLGEFVSADTISPIGDKVEGWAGKADIVPSLWNLQKAKADDPIYMLPMSGVYLYLYYREDWFKEAGLKAPETVDDFLTAAKALTKGTERYGFGMRGARGGHDPWAMFTYPLGLRFLDEKGEIALDTEKAVAANQWYLDLYLKEKVTPPSAPADGFAEIIGAFQSGKTAMLIHHIGSATGMIEKLGDSVSAVPMPSGPEGQWTVAAPDHNVVMKASKNADAGFKFISWMSEKDQNDYLCEQGSLMPVCASLQEKFAAKNRFYKASVDSIPIAGVFPLRPTLGKWTETVWPPTMQQALNGEITSAQMIKTLHDGLKG